MMVYPTKEVFLEKSKEGNLVPVWSEHQHRMKLQLLLMRKFVLFYEIVIRFHIVIYLRVLKESERLVDILSLEELLEPYYVLMVIRLRLKIITVRKQYAI